MIYAAFAGTGMRYWLRDPDHELFVKGRGWTPCGELRVGDRTVFGQVSCIGTLDELRRYWDSYGS